MAELKVTVLAEVDGQLLSGFPIIRRLTVADTQAFAYTQAAQGAGVFAAIPAEQIGTLQALVVRPEGAVTVRLDGQSDAGIVLNANGLLLILDSVIDAGAGAPNAKLNALAEAAVRGFAAGS